MRIHILKTVDKFFDAVKDGTKTFELRWNGDRHFKVGDTLQLQRVDSINRLFTGEIITKEISYILTEQDFPQGLRLGYVILGLR